MNEESVHDLQVKLKYAKIREAKVEGRYGPCTRCGNERYYYDSNAMPHNRICNECHDAKRRTALQQKFNFLVSGIISSIEVGYDELVEIRIMTLDGPCRITAGGWDEHYLEVERI